MLELASPAWVVAGVVLAALAYRTHGAIADTPVLRHPFAGLLAPEAIIPKRFNPRGWWFVSILFAILALTQPQWLSAWTTRPQLQRDIMIALDVSASMRAEDFLWDGQVVNRLTATKNLLRQLFALRAGDRFGIQLFGDDSFMLTPPTSDTALLNDLLAEIQPGIAGEKTALGDALLASVQHLTAQPGEAQKVLLLFSDGTRTAGRHHPLRALAIAQSSGVRIHTVGIGRDAPVPFPGAVTEAPKLVRLPLDEAMLRQIASDTGGHFFHVQSTQDLLALASQLGMLEPQSVIRYAQQRTALYWIPLLAALLVALIAYAKTYWHITPVPPR